MTTFKLGRRALIAAVAAVGLAGPVLADGHEVVDSIHFLIPGGAGGGWDGTARGTGEALTKGRSCRHRFLREHVGWRRR